MDTAAACVKLRMPGYIMTRRVNMPPALDLDFVRAQFPAFSEDSLENRPFFENAGGSYACAPVIDRLCRYYRRNKVQPYAAYPASREAGEQMDEARARLAAMLNMAPDELIFGPSTTQNAYVVSCAFGEILEPGDEIIVTNQDHEANSGCWRKLAKKGVVVHEWRMNPETGALETQELDKLLSERTKLVAFPHCSNIIGQINGAQAIVKRIHDAGALAIVDGVSYAPHGLPDIAAIDADVYFFSTYKTYGPHQGLMAVRGGLLDDLPNQGHWFNAEYPDKRLAPAGPDHAQIAACAGIADYFDTLHDHHLDANDNPAQRTREVSALFRAHETALMEPLLEFLQTCEGARLIGPHEPKDRAPTIALNTRRPPADIAADLAELGIMAGAGDFYALRTLQGLGIDPGRGVLRLSFVHYTSPYEIDQLIAALETTL